MYLFIHTRIYSYTHVSIHTHTYLFIHTRIYQTCVCHTSLDLLVSAACLFVHIQVSFVSLFARMQVFIQTWVLQSLCTCLRVHISMIENHFLFARVLGLSVINKHVAHHHHFLFSLLQKLRVYRCKLKKRICWQTSSHKWSTACNVRPLCTRTLMVWGKRWTNQGHMWRPCRERWLTKMPTHRIPSMFQESRTNSTQYRRRVRLWRGKTGSYVT